MLRIENLSTSYKIIGGKVNVLDNLNFTIEENEIFGIAGESGCGKTTLLRVLYDILDYPLQIDSGRAVLEGERNGEAFRYESGKIRDAWWKHISYVPQAAQSVMNPILRVKEHFLDSVGKEERKKIGDQAILDRVAKYLTELSLSPDLLNAYPFQLSGGMRQRVIIALATYMNPHMVLADEPTTALDVVVQRGILMMLMRLQEQYKNTMVIVSHDMGVHYQITDRIAIMYSGRIAELGPTEDIFNDPLHPYTKLLVDALPKVGEKGEKVGIPGRPPSLNNPPPGCRFAARCPFATDKCRQEVPEFREIRPGRFSACHYVTEAGLPQVDDLEERRRAIEERIAAEEMGLKRSQDGTVVGERDDDHEPEVSAQEIPDTTGSGAPPESIDPGRGGMHD